jgi:hypothetical protein
LKSVESISPSHPLLNRYTLLSKSSRKEVGEVVRLNAEVDEERRRRLYHILLDEGISFSDWLRKQIDAYIEKKEGKPRRRSKKGEGR